MLRELILTPPRLAFGAVDALAGGLRSVLPGNERVEATATPASWRQASTPGAPGSPAGAVKPVGRDPSAGDWDEDAPVPPGGSDPDDLVITDRVKTQLFGAVDAPTGQINLNVENGVVFLRGHLDDPDQAEELAVLAGAVEGVVGVKNLINT